MKFSLLRVCILLLIISLPGLAWAGAFSVAPTDKSMQYLGMIFGNVGSLPIAVCNPAITQGCIGGGNPLFGQLVYIFNNIVFALAIVIIAFTGMVGTINTAHEGEMMGKKWSSIWIPARAGIGMYLLLPAQAGGYSWIQIAVMWIIIQGVGAANALWKEAMEYNATGGSVVADTRQVNLQGAYTAVVSLFNSVLCMENLNSLMNSSPVIAQNLRNEPISIYQSQFSNQIQFGQRSQDGIQPALCGSVEIPDVGPTPFTAVNNYTNSQSQLRTQIMANAIILAATTLESSAVEALNSPSSDWSYGSEFVTAAQTLEGAVQNLSQTFASLPQVQQQSIMDGWIQAGSYYFQLVAGGTYINQSVSLTGSGINTTNLNTMLGSQGTQIASRIGSLSSSYQNYVTGLIRTIPLSQRQGSPMVPVTGVPGGGGGGVFGAIFGPNFFLDLVIGLGTYVTTGCYSSSGVVSQQNQNPIICIAGFGANLVNTAENAFWIAMGLLFLIQIFAAVMSCINPLGHAIQAALSLLVPLATLIITLLWGIGITMGLYIPMIPMLVFTFAAFTWIILVIEAMLGAPLIALTLIIPSEDEIGKATHGIMIIFGLVLRPGLMILGFIFSIQLIFVAVGMLNFGFSTSIKNTLTSGIGPFGAVGILTLYAYLITTFIHESFSLIHALPDKVMRWISGTGESSQASELTKGLGESVDKGAGYGKQAMSGGLARAGRKRKGGEG